MGARAQYIVVEGGNWSLHRSHWGAGRLAADLAFGPGAATRCFRACHQVDDSLRHSADEWLDDVWCEGAALVDHDRRLLLWFTDPADEWAERAAHRAILTRTWPGWEIRWAHDGVGDLLVALGLDRGLLREAEDTEEDGNAFWYPPEDDDDDYEVGVLMSKLRPDGVVDLWNAPYLGVGELLSSGRRLLDVLPADLPAPAMGAMPTGGIHFDPAIRTVGVWTTDVVVGLRDWPIAGWEGWELEFWGEDHRPHAELTTDRIRFPHIDLAPFLTQWLQRVGEPAPFPEAALALAMTPPPGADLTPVVHPQTTTEHASAEPTAEEHEALRTAIVGLVNEPPTDDLPH